MSQELRIIEHSYGSSTGPGPRHLLTDGAVAAETLCGVKRINVYRWASWELDNRVCARCLDVKRKAESPLLPPGLLPYEMEAALDEAATAVAQVAAARARLSRCLSTLQGARGPQMDALLKLAYERCGYTLAELGQTIGLTRERVRQRIAALDATPPSEASDAQA